VPMAPRPSSSPCWPTWASPWPSGTASGHARCPRQCGCRPHPAAPPDRPRAGPVPSPGTRRPPRRAGRLAPRQACDCGRPVAPHQAAPPAIHTDALGKYPLARPRRRDVATPEGQAGGRCLNLLAALRLSRPAQPDTRPHRPGRPRCPAPGPPDPPPRPRARRRGCPRPGDWRACSAILGITSPSLRYRPSGEGDKRRRPGRADRTLPGHRRSGSCQVTNAPAGGCPVLPPAPARRFGGKTRDLRSVRPKAKTGAGGKTRPACARAAVDHHRTTLWMSHGLQPPARANPGGSVRRGSGLSAVPQLRTQIGSIWPHCHLGSRGRRSMGRPSS
jgi:hypothetical protein